MPEITFQRLDRGGYWEKYPIYINREQVGRIAFASTLKLDLEPGRYFISTGGLGAADAEMWLDLGDHPKVLQIVGTLLPRKERIWPKWYQLSLKESTMVRKATLEDLSQLKYIYKQAMARAFGFMAVLVLAAAYLLYLGSIEENELLYYIALFPALLAPWAYRGVVVAQMRKEV